MRLLCSCNLPLPSFCDSGCVEADPLLSQVEVGCLHVRLDTYSSRLNCKQQAYHFFSTISNLHQPTVAGSHEGRVNEENLTTGQIRATIDRKWMDSWSGMSLFQMERMCRCLIDTSICRTPHMSTSHKFLRIPLDHEKCAPPQKITT